MQNGNKVETISKGYDDVSEAAPSHAQHLRDGISPRTWTIMLCGNLLMSMIGGYDTSNVANIQVPVYQAFGHIDLLPWVSLAYCLSAVAIVPFVRKLTSFCDLKWMALVSLCVIFGRVFMGLGSATIYQIILSYNVVFARPQELPLLQALVGASFAVGLISGPIVGGAFAENEHTTWRWAFYIVIPVLALTSLLLFFYPSHKFPTKKTTLQNLKEIDWVGCVLWAGVFVLFGLASIFSGTKWAWDSGAVIAVWTVFGLAVWAFIIQQYMSFFTTPEQRAFPVHLLTVSAVAIPSLCALLSAVAYGATLYYTPIYFAFTRGHGALGAAVRLLPFIGVFIFMIFLSGGLLPVLRYYKAFFLVGAVFVLIGGGLQQTVTSQTSESRVMGFEAVIAAGLGLMWQISLPIASAVLPPQYRIDAAALVNMCQMCGISISLAISGAIYENIGFGRIEDIVAGMGFSAHDIRELLSGADSPILSRLDPEVTLQVIDAATKAIVSCFNLTIGAGAICFIAACCMKFEALDFKKRSARKVDTEEYDKA
ncbi:hypothetical protein TruAng_001242 [Truncatella angustata]|nr:hypothetical protein TruAng_001242 [Truncatella angustata]